MSIISEMIDDNIEMNNRCISSMKSLIDGIEIRDKIIEQQEKIIVNQDLLIKELKLKINSNL